MSSLARAVRRPQLKYTVMLVILLVWVAQAVYESYTYKSGVIPPLSRSVVESMFIPKFLGRAIKYTFIVICLLRSWAYVFVDSNSDRRRRLFKLLRTVAIRIVAILMFINLWNQFINANGWNCEEYTRMMTTTMGGNIFEDGGQRYEVRLCEVRSMAPWFPERVRLHLFSYPGGELLAERIFYWSSVNDGMQFWDSRVITTNPGKLNYGSGDDDGYAGRLSLPPTKLDWLRARLP
jgi:hypothetical protein